MLAYEATPTGLRLSERNRPNPGPGEVAIDVGVARALSGGWAQCRIADCRDVAVIPADVDLGRAATLATAATTALAVLTLLLTHLVGLLQRGELKTFIQMRQPWEGLPAAAAAVLRPGFHGKAVLNVTGFTDPAPWPLP